MPESVIPESQVVLFTSVSVGDLFLDFMISVHLSARWLVSSVQTSDQCLYHTLVTVIVDFRLDWMRLRHPK